MSSKSNIQALVKALMEKDGMEQEAAENFVKTMFDIANEALQTDKLVKMRWLGSFKVLAVKDRESVDVNTGERIVIEGRDKISFTPDNILKELINKPFAQFDTVTVNEGVDFTEIDEKFAQQEAEEKEREEEAKNAAAMAKAAEEAAAKAAKAVAEAKAAEETAEKAAKAVAEAKTAEETVEMVSEEADEEVTEEVLDTDDTDEAEKVLGTDDTDEAENRVEEPSEPTPVIAPVVEPATEQATEPVAEQAAEPVAEPVSNPVVEPVSPPVSEPAPEPVTKPVSGPSPVPSRAHAHMVVPRYMVVVACCLIFALVLGMGWFAFSYGKMSAQRDYLAHQRDFLSTQLKNTAKQHPAAAPKPAVVPTEEDSVQEELKRKAQEDSARMAKVSEAIEMTDPAKEDKKKEEAAKEDKKSAKDEKKVAAKDEKKEPVKDDKKSQKADPAEQPDKYDSDVRIRTGAYRIVGVAQTVKVRAGQTLAGISKAYLGAGMECYVEALNGISQVKAGQDIKIPKLELKKKAKKN